MAPSLAELKAKSGAQGSRVTKAPSQFSTTANGTRPGKALYDAEPTVLSSRRQPKATQRLEEHKREVEANRRRREARGGRDDHNGEQKMQKLKASPNIITGDDDEDRDSNKENSPSAQLVGVIDSSNVEVLVDGVACVVNSNGETPRGSRVISPEELEGLLDPDADMDDGEEDVDLGGRKESEDKGHNNRFQFEEVHDLAPSKSSRSVPGSRPPLAKTSRHNVSGSSSIQVSRSSGSSTGSGRSDVARSERSGAQSRSSASIAASSVRSATGPVRTSKSTAHRSSPYIVSSNGRNTTPAVSRSSSISPSDAISSRGIDGTDHEDEAGVVEEGDFLSDEEVKHAKQKRDKASNYRAGAKAIIDSGRYDMSAWCAAVDPFPSSADLVIYAVECYRRSLEAHHRVPADEKISEIFPNEEVNKLIRDYCQHMRSACVSKLRPVVERVYGFSPNDSDDDIAANAKLCEQLLHQSNYLRLNPVPLDDTSPRPRTPGYYEHPAIRQGLGAALFYNEKAPGVKHRDYFEPMQFETVALICATMEHLISEWKSGIQSHATCKQETLKPKYEVIYHHLVDFSKKNPKRCEIVMERLTNYCKNKGPRKIVVNNHNGLDGDDFGSDIASGEE